MQRLRTGLVVALVVGFAVVAEAQDEHHWQIRTRALAILPDESTEPSATSTTQYDIEVRSNWAFEADFSYRPTSLLAAELDLVTSGLEVSRFGFSDGSLQLFLPSVLAQLHPLSHGRFDPYLGVGGNLTFFYENTGALRRFKFTNSSGWVVQGGCDVRIGERIALNADVKYISMSTDIRYSGGTVAVLGVDPLLVGLGFGYRF